MRTRPLILLPLALAGLALLPPLLKATRTESSMPNSRNAVTTDSSVNRPDASSCVSPCPTIR